MAAYFTPRFFFVLVIITFIFFSYGPKNNIAHPLKMCHFDQIYNIGDSISDTGNLIKEIPIGASTPFARLPYGGTFFKDATGRCSDGLLMIDYTAMVAGLPLLPPYNNMGADFTHGVNFAVAGSTALSSGALTAKNISSRVTSSSLDVQLEQMSNHFNSTCLEERDCVEKLENALFMVGGIGGSDYNYVFLQEERIDDLKHEVEEFASFFNNDYEKRSWFDLNRIIPEVVNVVIDAVKSVIDLGATRVVVQGSLPLGCLPIYKTTFKTYVSEAYDENQCLKLLNQFSGYHNELLETAVEKLKQEKPNVIVVYGDYEKAYKHLLKFARAHEFDTEKACCGVGGEYNFNMTRMCGAPGVPVCEDPQRYMSWDGVHLTQEAYKIMTGWLLGDIMDYDKLQCRH